MATGMTEEQITKAIIAWLESRGWEIICYDFPQSGMGVYLHPNNVTSKNLKAIVPDIVAFRDGIVVYFENKDHFDIGDFLKVDTLRKTQAYGNAFSRLLGERVYSKIYYGIGLPLTSRIKQRAIQSISLTDFVVLVGDDVFEVMGDFKEVL